MFPASGHLRPPPNDFAKAFPFVRKTPTYVWGNAHPGIMRGPAFYNADWSAGKIFALKTLLAVEPTTLEVRAESFNIFNHDINNPQYGQIFNTQGDMRRMQFEVHLRF